MIKGVKTYQKGQIKLWNSWKQPQCHAARSLHQKMSHGNCVQHPFCALNPGLAMSASHIYIQKLLQQGGPNSVGSNLGEVVSLDILICPKKWNAPNFFARIRRNSEDHEETPSTRMCTMPQQERSDTNKMQKKFAPATASCYNATSTARSAKHECSKCELAAGGESLKLTERC